MKSNNIKIERDELKKAILEKGLLINLKVALLLLAPKGSVINFDFKISKNMVSWRGVQHTLTNDPLSDAIKVINFSIMENDVFLDLNSSLIERVVFKQNGANIYGFNMEIIFGNGYHYSPVEDESEFIKYVKESLHTGNSIDYEYFLADKIGFKFVNLKNTVGSTMIEDSTLINMLSDKYEDDLFITGYQKNGLSRVLELTGTKIKTKLNISNGVSWHETIELDSQYEIF